MEVLEYNSLDISGIQLKYHKIRDMIQKGDFASAQVKKLTGSEYYSARLDHTNRLLFKMIKHQGKSYALLLEIIRNHDYNNARFLNGGKIIEEDIVFNNISAEEEMKYVNQNHSSVYFLNKAVSFDDQQLVIYKERLPLIIIGSAGSGKTMLALEKIKTLYGNCLYVSLSPYLVNYSRNIYYSNNYQNEDQEVDFLSFNEFIETLKIPQSNSMDFYSFKVWFGRFKGLDIDKVYEEFRGTITGTNVDKAFLTKEDYLALGIKQSLFLEGDREKVYNLFQKYLDFIKAKNFYDPNIIAHEYIKLVKHKYDYIIIDEVQDLTNIQIKLLLGSLRNSGDFILCGDSNQIVHPNFFSWAKIKTLLYKEPRDNIMFLLTANYRNSKNVVDIANNVLKIKQKQFGSIDKESNYLIESLADNAGQIVAFNRNEIERLNQISKRSTKYAIIVLTEEQKLEAKKYFANPLIFSIHDTKGLEYDNIILFNIVSSASKEFAEIAYGITAEDLKKDLSYSRSKDKTDKSIEAYKFYINAFYVAITRAIDNVYIVEDNRSSFLDLLNLKQYGSASLTQNDSTIEEWQTEATRLEKQGKLEQARNIREVILQEKKVPWTVMTEAEYQQLCLGSSKAEKILSLEYALIYNRHDTIKKLQEQNLKAAMHCQSSYSVIKEKYYSEYIRKSHGAVVNLIKEYGPNFKNQFNQTPLVVASYFKNAALVELLLRQGAVDTLDNNGLTALQSFLSIVTFSQKASEEDPAIYQMLTANSTTLKIGDKLIKLYPHTMEFFLYNTLVGLLANGLYYPQWMFGGFSAMSLTDSMAPLSILPAARKKRSYISYILAKNEKDRQGDYNLQLFIRLRRGFYLINPEIEIKVNDAWQKLYNVINFNLDQEYEEYSQRWGLKRMLVR